MNTSHFIKESPAAVPHFSIHSHGTSASAIPDATLINKVLNAGYLAANSNTKGVCTLLSSRRYLSKLFLPLFVFFMVSPSFSCAEEPNPNPNDKLPWGIFPLNDVS